MQLVYTTPHKYYNIIIQSFAVVFTRRAVSVYAGIRLDDKRKKNGITPVVLVIYNKVEREINKLKQETA